MARRFSISGASEGVGMYQTNGAESYVFHSNGCPYGLVLGRGDIPSFYRFEDLIFEDWSGYLDGDQSRIARVIRASDRRTNISVSV